jgi:hypothetical protein
MRIVTCVLLGTLAAAPAAGLESLSGSYEGKLVCKGVVAGDFDKQKTDVEVGIFDDGAGGLTLSITDVGTLLGFALTDTSKPETGTLSAVDCSLDVVTLTGAALHAEVKVKAGSDKASLKGTLTRMNEGGAQSGLCQLDAKRVSTIAPKLPGCP